MQIENYEEKKEDHKLSNMKEFILQLTKMPRVSEKWITSSVLGKKEKKYGQSLAIIMQCNP